MIGWRVTLLLCCAILCWGQDTHWNWLCGDTSQDGVNIDQILGRWYMAATNNPQVAQGIPCIGVTFNWQDVNNSTLLFHAYNDVSNDGFEYVRNLTFDVITPSKWIYESIMFKVVDLPPEGDILALSACKNITNQGNWTVDQITFVFSKSKTPDTQSVYNRLREAGISHWNYMITFNLSSCEPSFP